jgi:hypothetical protein
MFEGILIGLVLFCAPILIGMAVVLLWKRLC